MLVPFCCKAVDGKYNVNNRTNIMQRLRCCFCVIANNALLMNGNNIYKPTYALANQYWFVSSGINAFTNPKIENVFLPITIKIKYKIVQACLQVSRPKGFHSKRYVKE